MMIPRVLTLGTFGIPHMGHAAFLRRCEAFGELTVGVNSDAFVERYKGIRPPFDQDERMALISSLGYRVTLNDGPGRACIDLVGPDVIAVGSDWARRDYLAQIDCDQDWLDGRHITIAYVPMRPVGISSSEIVLRSITKPGPIPPIPD